MKISFAHCSNYYYPIYYLFKNTLNSYILIPPTPTKKTIELGSKYSPDYICLPFKYNLGNFIEALDKGANVIIHAGGGCKYGYYPEVQEKILKDLGYKFEFYNLVSRRVLSFKRIFNIFKKINPKLKFSLFLKTLVYSSLFTLFLDKLENYIRLNTVYIEDKNIYLKIKKSFINISLNNKNILSLIKNYYKYFRILKKVKKNKKKKVLKIGIIGELYTNMNSIANNNLEEKLYDLNVSIKRFTNASYLLFFKKIFEPILLFKIRKYTKHTLGSDAHDNIYRMLYLKRKKYDGIIHIKPAFCTPEIGVIPILENISEEEDIPIMYITQDVGNSDEGINTRLEAFIDMLEMRKNNE